MVISTHPILRNAIPISHKNAKFPCLEPCSNPLNAFIYIIYSTQPIVLAVALGVAKYPYLLGWGSLHLPNHPQCAQDVVVGAPPWSEVAVASVVVVAGTAVVLVIVEVMVVVLESKQPPNQP